MKFCSTSQGSVRVKAAQHNIIEITARPPPTKTTFVDLVFVDVGDETYTKYKSRDVLTVLYLRKGGGVHGIRSQPLLQAFDRYNLVKLCRIVRNL